MKSNKQSNSTNRRLTIGYFAPSMGGFGQLVWSGIVDMARKKDVNLICFEGAILREPTFWAQANIIYDLATANNVDGVISWASMLGDFFTIDELEAFHERYHSVPVVTMGKLLGKLPGILMDSYNGMREAVSHLIETHGYRRIAFIRGPEDHIYAQERYRAYVETLEAYDIPFDPKLVTPPATWTYPEGRTTGKEAIHLLLDECGLHPQTDLEAVVAASEIILLGAVENLQAREINIPGQVAVVGFDDTILGQTNIPPLTSVAPPFYKTGSQAVEILLTLMEGGQVPHETIVPSRLVIRQSCGCLLPPVVQVTTGPVDVKAETLETFLAAQQVEIISEMRQQIGNSAEPIADDWAERLLQNFVTELQVKSSGIFLQELDGMLRLEIKGNGDMIAWQGVVSVLRQKTLPYLQGEALWQAINLWEQAHIIIGEAVRQQQAYQNLQADQLAQTLREIGAMLITMFDVGRLMDILAEKLPNLGIPSYYLALYESPQPYEYPQPAPEWSRLMLAYTEKGRVELESGGKRFRSNDLLPEGMWPEGRRVSFLVEPLYFQNNQLGFTLFEIGPGEATIYQTLRMQISSALQGALLVQQIQENTAEITRQKYILDTFMENVPDLIYFKDRDSRIIQVNQAYANFFRYNHPAELVGKSDFDLFSDGPAHVKYEQEQEIIRTGYPILDMEEVGSISGHWVLTSKMPLRNEYNEIIGTFGISRDITPLKQAQLVLAQQARQLQTVAEVATATSTILNTDELLQQVVDLTKTRFGLYHAHIYLLNETGDILELKAGAGQKGRKMVAQGWAIPLAAEKSLVARTARKRQGEMVNNVQENPYWLSNPLLPNTRSELAVPLIVGDQLLGVIDVQADEVDYFAEEDVRTKSTLAAQIAVAIKNAQLYHKEAERARELAKLNLDLNAAQAELLRQERLATLGQLTAIVSHELRNPLATIRASAFSVDRRVRDKDLGVESALDRIQRSITRCDNIIAELLDYTHIHDLNLQPIVFDDWLMQVLDEQPLPEDITLSVDLTAGVEVLLDRERFRRVIINLIDNAYQSIKEKTDSGRSKQTVSIQSEAIKEQLKLTITDTGPGIPPEVMPHIFEPLYSTKNFGMGLGLPVVQEIIHQHRGKIEIDSEADAGTQVVVWLPLG